MITKKLYGSPAAFAAATHGLFHMNTIRSWAQDGRIRGVLITPSGRILIPWTALDSLLTAVDRAYWLMWSYKCGPLSFDVLRYQDWSIGVMLSRGTEDGYDYIHLDISVPFGSISIEWDFR